MSKLNFIKDATINAIKKEPIAVALIATAAVGYAALVVNTKFKEKSRAKAAAVKPEAKAEAAPASEAKAEPAPAPAPEAASAPEAPAAEQQ